MDVTTAAVSKEGVQCPLWVISGHSAEQRCPLHPQEQTCLASATMSAKCQKQTYLPPDRIVRFHPAETCKSNVRFGVNS